VDWDAIAAMGELVSSVAVVVTLIYLAVQTHQTKQQTITQTSYASAAAVRDELMAFIEPQLLAQALVKSYSAPTELNDVEKINVDAWMQLSMHMRECEYYEWKRGTLPRERWQALQQIISINLSAQWCREWWSTHGRATKTAEFASFVDELIKGQDLVRDYFEAGNWLMRDGEPRA
jgi:hypothetical protein